MKDLIIIGAGNVGGFLALNQDLFTDKYNIIGFLDDDVAKIGKIFCGLKVLGKISSLKDYKNICDLCHMNVFRAIYRLECSNILCKHITYIIISMYHH